MKKVIALVSGGKDSCYSMMEVVAQGHELVAIANLHPVDEETDELDSYMYQTVGHSLIAAYADALDVPLFRRGIAGSSANKDKVYRPTEGDEVEDLRALLLEVKAAVPEADAIASGAILSDYQRTRVEHVASSLGLASFAYLWHRSQDLLLDAMIESGIDAILVKIAAMGLAVDRHLGAHLADIRDHLFSLNAKYTSHICGEGGEYETLTLDAPLFTSRIVLTETTTVVVDESMFAPVAHLTVNGFTLEAKDPAVRAEQLAQMRGVLAASAAAEIEARNARRALPGLAAAATDTPLAVPAMVGYSQAGQGGAPPAQLRVTALAPETRLVALQAWSAPAASLEDEVAAVMGALADGLASVGASWSDVAFTSIFTQDLSQFGAINAAYGPYFGVNPPARATLQLPLAGDARLKIEMWAAVNSCTPATLHVQSISHWAPANIGPYSQVKDVDGVLLMAGQIGMDPASMVIPQPASAAGEAVQIVANIDAVLEVMASGPAGVASALVWANSLDDAANVYMPAWRAYLADAVTGMAVLAHSPFLPRSALLEVQVLAVTTALDDDLSPVTTGSADGVAPGVSLTTATRSWSTSAGSPASLLLANVYATDGSCERDADAAVTALAAGLVAATERAAVPPSLVRVYLPTALDASAVQAALDTVAVCPVSVLPVEGAVAVTFDADSSLASVPDAGSIMAVLELSSLP
ncbi:ATP-binding domain-containing protein 4 [Thecamonas trahens ATCC 50062]|uniref:Diphthine--ammonia ligase n=1 Tax=Thecamonas trahens ATCC 50062 TaxID=461836 RepID=A0A0L0D6H3_THETB|nr:ATP-binding domain-containing protein 4 [Thecamonas trahens ATCC 50062]KNC47982.1 ATP-binding domain-containing protein 4 [Thecamonas trahens ATCC 50062]|eukprot:XP_013758999.1 ATP-binding domain-containing protein 4 [Thecamonas trahens ATCC 50062]